MQSAKRRCRCARIETSSILFYILRSIRNARTGLHLISTRSERVARVETRNPEASIFAMEIEHRRRIISSLNFARTFFRTVSRITAERNDETSVRHTIPKRVSLRFSDVFSVTSRYYRCVCVTQSRNALGNFLSKLFQRVSSVYARTRAYIFARNHLRFP